MSKAKLFLPVICGPTASGKSALAVEYARRVNGEVVSADSMQIYRDLTIGTARTTEEEMQECSGFVIRNTVSMPGRS